MGDRWYCSDCMVKDDVRQNLDNVICGYADDLSNGVCPTCGKEDSLIWFADVPCAECPMQGKCC